MNTRSSRWCSSTHSYLLQNQERVWKAEQAHKEEQKKIEELRRQRQEERQIEELRALQDGGSQRQPRLEWMYSGEAAMMPTSDEYLLGKEWKAEEDKDDVARLNSDAALPGANFISSASAAAPAGAAGAAVPSSAAQEPMTEAQLRTKEFAVKQHDPLFAMKSAQASAREQVLSNPLMMARIKQQLMGVQGGHSDSDSSREDRRRHRRRHRSSRHRSSRSDRRGGHSDEEGGGDDKRSRRRRHRDDSPSRSHRSRHSRSSRRREDGERRRSRSHRRDAGRSRSPPRHSRDAGRSRSPPRHSRDAGRSRSPPRHSRDAGRSRSPPRHSRDAGRSRSPPRHRASPGAVAMDHRRIRRSVSPRSVSASPPPGRRWGGGASARHRSPSDRGGLQPRHTQHEGHSDQYRRSEGRGDPKEPPAAPHRRPGYGLQRASGEALEVRRSAEVGPSADAVAARQQAVLEERRAALAAAAAARGGRRPTEMTAAERAARLAAMQGDAEATVQQRKEADKQRAAREAQEAEAEAAAHTGRGGGMAALLQGSSLDDAIDTLRQRKGREAHGRGDH